MSSEDEQQKKTTTPNTENTWKPVIPTVAFPLKPKSNNNKNVLQKYFNNLAGDPSARFLFNESGLWHQGIHLRAEKFKSSEFDNQQICAIADGELIAYKVDSAYKMEDEDAGASYSTGFFLLEHHLEYPKDNKLTFYSFYRHTAELKKYDATVSKILGETKSADKYPVMIRNEHNQATGKTLPDGVVLEVRKNHHNKTHYDELIWYKDKVTNQEVRPEKGRWKIYSKSYRVMIEESLPAIPLLAENGIETQTDKDVALDNPIKVKAGDVLGLMGEYNQTEENGKRLLHLEVFTYDDIEVFRNKAKEAYQQDKKQDKEKRSLPDNFLYVDRNQPYYSLVGKEPTQIGETQTEIFVPLSELEKKSVKVKDDQGKEISKDYYNIQPYLHQSTTNSNVGIYVDDSHLTQGITFPGMNVFTTQSNGVDIFDQTLCHYLNPDEKDLESKEKLNPLFKAIMEELDLDKEKGKPVRFEAGRLHQLSLDAIQHRRFIGIIPKHQNEWASNRVQQFEKLCRVFIDPNQAKTAQQIRKRVSDLSIQLKVRSFDTDKEAYFIHPLGLIGWLLKSKTWQGDFIRFRLNNDKDYVISKETFQSILKNESYGEYPYVPKGSSTSGITIGYGYDLGQQTKEQIESDLGEFFSSNEIVAFQSVSGLKGATARAALNQVSSISISKDDALRLSSKTKTRYAQDTFNIWPEVINLHPHCQGALLSIVYNRGNSLQDPKTSKVPEPRREMREIRTLLKNGEYSMIPQKITDMKRIWVGQGQDGLLYRRDEEALFFKKGLEIDGYE